MGSPLLIQTGLIATGGLRRQDSVAAGFDLVPVATDVVLVHDAARPFVTGDVIGTDADRFLTDSGCRWLAKPFRLSELLRIAREVMKV